MVHKKDGKTLRNGVNKKPPDKALRQILLRYAPAIEIRRFLLLTDQDIVMNELDLVSGDCYMKSSILHARQMTDRLSNHVLLRLISYQ